MRVRVIEAASERKAKSVSAVGEGRRRIATPASRVARLGVGTAETDEIDGLTLLQQLDKTVLLPIEIAAADKGDIGDPLGRCQAVVRCASGCGADHHVDAGAERLVRKCELLGVSCRSEALASGSPDRVA